MAGTLTIHSSGSGELLSGHSWIEYTDGAGETHTYGTWGNNPEGLGNGLHMDLERGRSSDARRSARLTDAQERAMNAKIQEYRDKGQGGWGYLSPCSAFAADVWQAGTGEKLSHRSGIISNPSRLKKSIQTANGTPAASAPAAPGDGRPSGSRQSFARPVSQCRARGP
ncbi:MAG TPA: hypothetical protein VD887_11450 [Allosphingosinicella sp.]|nr:hypothetical protein [Allosphingosinicella sp.]